MNAIDAKNIMVAADAVDNSVMVLDSIRVAAENRKGEIEVHGDNMTSATRVHLASLGYVVRFKYLASWLGSGSWWTVSW